MLFENVPDLEPDIGVREWVRRVTQDAVEAFERVGVFSLLLVDDPKAEQNLVRLVEIW